MSTNNPRTAHVCVLCGREGTKSVVRQKDGRYLCRGKSACRERRQAIAYKLAQEKAQKELKELKEQREALHAVKAVQAP